MHHADAPTLFCPFCLPYEQEIHHLSNSQDSIYSQHSHLLLTGYALIIAYFCSVNNSLWTSGVKNRVNMPKSFPCHFSHSPQQSNLELSLKRDKKIDGPRNSS